MLLTKTESDVHFSLRVLFVLLLALMHFFCSKNVFAFAFEGGRAQSDRKADPFVPYDAMRADLAPDPKTYDMKGVLVLRPEKNDPEFGKVFVHSEDSTILFKVRFVLKVIGDNIPIFLKNPKKNSAWFKKTPEGKFLVFDTILDSPESYVVFNCHYGNNNIGERGFFVRLQEFEAHRRLNQSVGVRYWIKGAAIGLANIKIFQSYLPEVKQLDLSAKFMLIHTWHKKNFGPRWQVGLSGYSTVSPLSAAPADYKLRYFGLNARGTFWTYPWDRLGIGYSLGYYYATTFQLGSDIGYKSLIGPQIYPLLYYRLSSKWALNSYFKFSPISNGIKLTSFKNREIAAGLGLAYTVRNTWRVFVSYDYSNLNFYTSDLSLKTFVNSYSIGISN